ncbi:hypothetical protein LZK75_20165 [Rhizobium leguminosarum]|nr:hypothetical protein LZK75_20165 [Rhizobium leguminosarum]
MRLGEHAQHDGAFGDEAVLSAGQVALANIAEFGDARIVGAVDVDRNGGHAGLNCPRR